MRIMHSCAVPLSFIHEYMYCKNKEILPKYKFPVAGAPRKLWGKVSLTTTAMQMSSQVAGYSFLKYNITHLDGREDIL